MELSPSITTKDILFESGNSENGNSDNPIFDVSLLNLNNVVGMQFLFANVPFVYNIVDATNNQFILTDANNVSGVLVTLPVGNYTASQWPYIFNKALQTAGVTGYADYLSYYDTVTNQIVFVNNAGTPITFTIDCTLANVPNSIGKYDTFGMNLISYTAVTSPTLLYNGSLTSAPFTGTPYYIASSYTASLSGPNEMYLHSSLASAFSPSAIIYDTIVNNSMGDVIGFWPINTINSGTIQYQPNSPNLLKCGQPQKISKLSFYLTIGTQTTYSTATQYGQSATAQGSNIGNVPYLPLGGTSWQIGMRFFVQNNQITSISNPRGEGFVTSQSYGTGNVVRDLKKPRLF